MAFFDSAWVQILIDDLNQHCVGVCSYWIKSLVGTKVPIFDCFRAFVGI